MANGGVRDEGREAFWRRVIQGQRGSGLTIREFCHKSKMPESAFYFWRSELERRESRRRGAKPGRLRQRIGRSCSRRASATAAFVPVKLTQEIPAQVRGGIQIELPGSRRVHVTTPVDRQALADVLAVLEARPC
jgi:hypothetical protein